MNRKEKKRLKCSACVVGSVDGKTGERLFATTDQLWAHISTVHFSFHPFECVLCTMMFMPSEGVLKLHYEQIHPQKTPQAIYTYDEKKKTEIREIFLESQRLSSFVHSVPTEKTNNQQKILPGCGADTFNAVSWKSADRIVADAKAKSPLIQTNFKATVVQNSVVPQQQMETTCDINLSDSVSWEENKEEVAQSIIEMPLKIPAVPIPVAAVRTEEKRQNHPANKKQRPEISPTSLDTPEIVRWRLNQLLRVPGIEDTGKSQQPADTQSSTEANVQQLEQTDNCDSNGSDVEIWEEEDEVALEVEQEEKRLNEQMEFNIFLPKEQQQKKIQSQIVVRPTSATAVEQKTPKSGFVTVSQSIVCQLCSKEVQNIVSLKSKHIWTRHTTSPRYSCNACEYGCQRLQQIKRHVEVKHNHKSGIRWKEHRPEGTPNFKQQYNRAFGKWVKPRSRRMTGACQLCSVAVAPGNRTCHIWQCHMSKAKYICRRCDVGVAKVHEIKQHLRVAEHGNADDQTAWTDNTLTLHPEYVTKVIAAFGV